MRFTISLSPDQPFHNLSAPLSLGVEATLAQLERLVLRESAWRVALDPHGVCHRCGAGSRLPGTGHRLLVQGRPGGDGGMMGWWDVMGQVVFFPAQYFFLPDYFPKKRWYDECGGTLCDQIKAQGWRSQQQTRCWSNQFWFSWQMEPISWTCNPQSSWKFNLFKKLMIGFRKAVTK